MSLRLTYRVLPKSRNGRIPRPRSRYACARLHPATRIGVPDANYSALLQEILVEPAQHFSKENAADVVLDED
jgi:hypothetical protein